MPSGPANDAVELPREVRGVAQSGAHALPGERRHEMRRVAGQEGTPGAPLFGVTRVEGVDGVALEPGVARVLLFGEWSGSAQA